MSKYLICLKKEFTENLRTKKFFVLICVFAFFAMLSPFISRYMNEFLLMVLGQEDAAGLIQIFPEPYWTDSYVQLYGNLTQIGILTVMLLFMDAVLREKRRGTTDIVFTKGVSTATFILSKYTAAVSLSWASLFIAVFITYFYTHLLFGYAGNIGNVLMGAFAFGILLSMMQALGLLASTIAKSTAMSAITSFSFFLVVILLSYIPRIGTWLPGGLMIGNMQLTLGNMYNEFAVNILLAVGVVIVALAISIRSLKKQEA